MIINNGPIGSGKFNPEKDLLFTYTLDETQKTNQSFSQALEDGIVQLNENVLWIYKTCDFKLKKKIKQCNICCCGGGGSGANYRSGSLASSYGGGGGGGGQVNVLENQILNTGFYTVNCGTGGAVPTTENGKAGNSGDSTYFKIKNNENNIIIANGGSGGGNENDNDKNGTGGAQYQRGGNGASGANDAPVQGNTNGPAAGIEISFLSNVQIAAGGGGGAGAYYISTNNYDSGEPAQPGSHTATYGQGGQGGTYGSPDGKKGYDGVFILQYLN